MKRHLLLLAALTLSIPAVAADPAASFADAARRHRAGDTAAAIAFWTPLAPLSRPACTSPGKSAAPATVSPRPAR
jgi:hypothetical protein